MFTENLPWLDINANGEFLLLNPHNFISRYYYNSHFTDWENGTDTNPESYGWWTQDLNPTFTSEPKSQH